MGVVMGERGRGMAARGVARRRGAGRRGGERRGGVYVAVLGSSMLVMVMGMAALATVRVHRVGVTMTNDATRARVRADAGIQLGLAYIARDAAWRSTYSSGVWAADVALGDGLITLEGIDPVDGDLANRPTDPLVLRATGGRGVARHITEVGLAADVTPLDALRMALHTEGQIAVVGGATLSAPGGIVSTNTTLSNSGHIEGDVEATAVAGTGTISGTVTVLAPPKALPDGAVVEMYAGLGTEIDPAGAIDRGVLAPGLNPYGTPDPDGVYVVRSASHVVVKDSRIHGTLVVIAPGREVRLEGKLLLHNARADYPALIVDGDLVLRFDSSTDLLESSISTNLNPAGAPYLGESDSDVLDAYPSEVRGLVHVTGRVVFESTSRVRGAVLGASASASDAVDVRGAPEIVYDPSLWTSPPMGYAQGAAMRIVPGSWKQSAAP